MPLPLSLYIALWLVHFSATHANEGYKFIAILPAILSILCFMYTVKSAAMLKVCMLECSFEFVSSLLNGFTVCA